jgi:hypothetical protein
MFTISSYTRRISVGLHLYVILQHVIDTFDQGLHDWGVDEDTVQSEVKESESERGKTKL